MLFRIFATAILAAFYGIYFTKLIILNRKSIRTNQMGIGKKPKNVLAIERMTSLATVLTAILDAGSIFMAKEVPSFPIKAAGVILGVASVILFAASTVTMKNNWRVGIPEEKTDLVRNGIYKWSRNPAFLGFDLLYCSMCFLFFNIPLFLVSLWAAIMLHLQILQEEEYMRKMFGKDYADYQQHTLRYLGKR